MKDIAHTNYFNNERAAALYVTGRPDFHHITIEHIRSSLKLYDPLPRALDIACGTGLSSKALQTVASEVYATDSSQSMIDHAACKDRIIYIKADAGNQPFDDGFFDLITVSSGIHWFEIDSFLVEASRLLKPGAWLVVYDNFFMAEMEDDPAFKEWHQNIYLQHYPAPARNDRYDWSASNLSTKRFALIQEESYINTVAFSHHDLVNYCMSQSNTLSPVENGRTSDKSVRDWLHTELLPFFPEQNQQRNFRFGNLIQYLIKQ